MDKITIKNISTATIILSFDDLKFRRELVPGRSVSVEKNVYEEMTFDPGFNSMVDEHYLKIIGLDDDEQVAVSATPIFENSAIAKILDSQDITAFAKMIPTAAPAEKESVVQLAIEKRITNPAFVSLIKKYCDVDIISAINMKHLAEDD